MKNFKLYVTALVVTLSLGACESDDDSTPELINEEEVITTVRLTLTPDSGSVVTLLAVDSDGEGPNDTEFTVSGNLMANTSYSGAVQFLNETETPAEDITEEVEEEADEHQVFYLSQGGLDFSVEYENFDGDNNPLGTLITLTTGEAGTGQLNVTLRHEPSKPNDGTLADAGGETDVSVSFDVEIE